MDSHMPLDFRSLDTTLDYGMPFARHSASPDPAVWLHDYGSSGSQFTSSPIPSYDRSLPDYNVITYSADREKPASWYLQDHWSSRIQSSADPADRTLKDAISLHGPPPFDRVSVPSLPFQQVDQSVWAVLILKLWNALNSSAAHSHAINRLVVDTQSSWAVHTSFPIKSPSLRKAVLDVDQKIRLNERLQELSRTALERASSDDTSPIHRALTEAGEFIGCLPFPLTFMPEISLAHDGEINFFWQNDMFYLDLGFYGDGHGSCFARTVSGRKIHLDRIIPKGPLPPELRELFDSNKNNPDAIPPS